MGTESATSRQLRYAIDDPVSPAESKHSVDAVSGSFSNTSLDQAAIKAKIAQLEAQLQKAQSPGALLDDSDSDSDVIVKTKSG